MSREDRKHHWRNVRCLGCDRQCRYRDFKVFDRNGFRETYDMLKDDQIDSSLWRYKRRGTILGLMHEMKRERWELETRACQEAQAEGEYRAHALG